MVKSPAVSSSPSPRDRRQFRRIRTALYCRPAGVEFLARQREPVDVSLGGVRIFSDDEMRVGELLKLEFFLADVPPVTYTAEVVWVERLAADAPARFDVGLKFIQLEPEALSLLARVLGPPEDQGEDEGDEAGHGGGDRPKQR
jgi:hypothetical protein